MPKLLPAVVKLPPRRRTVALPRGEPCHKRCIMRETESPAQLSTQRSPAGQTVVPLSGPRPIDTYPHRPINHKGSREPWILFVVPQLMPIIPAAVHLHIILQHPALICNPHASQIGRIEIQPEGPDEPPSNTTVRLPGKTERAPILPQPSPNPVQGWFYEPEPRFLPAEPIPQVFLPRLMGKVLILSEPTPQVAICVTEITSTTSTPWPTPPPRPLPCLPEWSIPQPMAPVWPRSPMPNQPIETELAPGLPLHDTPRIGYSQTDARFLPAELSPKDLVQHALGSTVVLPLAPLPIPTPPRTVTVTVTPPPDISCIHCIHCPTPRYMECLPEWSIPQPVAPVWPRSPMPSYPLSTEPAPALPHRTNSQMRHVHCSHPNPDLNLLSAAPVGRSWLHALDEAFILPTAPIPPPPIQPKIEIAVDTVAPTGPPCPGLTIPPRAPTAPAIWTRAPTPSPKVPKTSPFNPWGSPKGKAKARKQKHLLPPGDCSESRHPWNSSTKVVPPMHK